MFSATCRLWVSPFFLLKYAFPAPIKRVVTLLISFEHCGKGKIYADKAKGQAKYMVHLVPNMCTKWYHKLYTVRMHRAIVRNHLNWQFLFHCRSDTYNGPVEKTYGMSGQSFWRNKKVISYIIWITSYINWYYQLLKSEWNVSTFSH